jgi:hypothetical protein
MSKELKQAPALLPSDAARFLTHSSLGPGVFVLRRYDQREDGLDIIEGHTHPRIAVSWFTPSKLGSPVLWGAFSMVRDLVLHILRSSRA